jgi:hypothetical protein
LFIFVYETIPSFKGKVSNVSCLCMNTWKRFLAVIEHHDSKVDYWN